MPNATVLSSVPMSDPRITDINFELEKENFPVTKRIKFIADLGACKEIAYHYELICKDWKEDKKLNIESSFDRHGSEGIEFLFE